MNIVDHSTLHRGAKYFMDTGRASSHAEAMGLLQQFGLTVYVGTEATHSVAHQIALLTLVNITRRTFLGGVVVVGVPDCIDLTGLSGKSTLKEACVDLGGIVADVYPPHWPAAIIGDINVQGGDEAPVWRITWDGWRGGVIPPLLGGRLSEDGRMLLAPALAAAMCAAECFSFHAGDHPLAGRRSAGLSLWNPRSDWTTADGSEPIIHYLPGQLWIIGLGNLGQAFAWLLACLPYQDRSALRLVLQDFDLVSPSNDSTSLLSYTQHVGQMKTRMVAEWLDMRGFKTLIEERHFGPWTQRHPEEPGVALCGVDNAVARACLDKTGFGLIVEAGLGGGTQAFRSLGVHTFPSSRTPAELWAKQTALGNVSTENMPAYQALKRGGMDVCGLTQLATRTVGVPFVGLVAGCLAISELLRRLHGGSALEFVTGSLAAPSDFEMGEIDSGPYEHGFCLALQP